MHQDKAWEVFSVGTVVDVTGKGAFINDIPQVGVSDFVTLAIRL